ncbi:MAG TPA: AIR synthase related protein [Acidimicrobiales bacterium]|nr:AIR synthase related protein [Acidimicrobiales bacterium]
MTPDETLSDLGERRLVAEVLGPRYRYQPGFGDDCAPVPPPAAADFELVATTDPCPAPLVSSLGWDDLYHRGWLLATINLSDLAAAGAEPLGLMVSYVLPGDLPVARFERLVSGVDDCCSAHGTRVLGGNIGDGAAIHLTATAIGWCPAGRRLSRRGARPGDALLLVGSPGYLWSTALLRHGRASLPEPAATAVADRALHPRAQIAAARALAAEGLVHAAVDVSDGLYASVVSLCETNGLGARLDPDVRLDPAVAEVCRQAAVDPFDLAQLWGDWTLLVAVAPAATGRVREVAARLGSEAHLLGVMTEAPAIVVAGPGGDTPWVGADAERFTASSWHTDRVGAYLSRLAGRAPSDGAGGAPVIGGR